MSESAALSIPPETTSSIRPPPVAPGGAPATGAMREPDAVDITEEAAL